MPQSSKWPLGQDQPSSCEWPQPGEGRVGQERGGAEQWGNKTSVRWSRLARRSDKAKTQTQREDGDNKRREEEGGREEERKGELWRVRESQRESERQASESVRERGEVQPIRDEMELLESERRILSPGCCTEEREKREGGRKRGGGGRERTEDHATCNTTLLFKRDEEEGNYKWDRRESEEKPRLCKYRNKTWDGIRWLLEDWRRTDRRGEWGKVRGWREKQKHRLWTAPERRGSVSLHHLLTDNSTNSSQIGAVCVFLLSLLCSVHSRWFLRTAVWVCACLNPTGITFYWKTCNT